MKNIFKFDYNHSILAVSNSLLKHYGVPTFHPSLKSLDERLNKNPQNIILMILDGMGIDLIKKICRKEVLSGSILPRQYFLFFHQPPRQQQLLSIQG